MSAIKRWPICVFSYLITNVRLQSTLHTCASMAVRMVIKCPRTHLYTSLYTCLRRYGNRRAYAHFCKPVETLVPDTLLSMCLNERLLTHPSHFSRCLPFVPAPISMHAHACGVYEHVSADAEQFVRVEHRDTEKCCCPSVSRHCILVMAY